MWSGSLMRLPKLSASPDSRSADESAGLDRGILRARDEISSSYERRACGDVRPPNWIHTINGIGLEIEEGASRSAGTERGRQDHPGKGRAACAEIELKLLGTQIRRCPRLRGSRPAWMRRPVSLTFAPLSASFGMQRAASR